MMNKGKNSILIDIGTNGEMALFDNKTLICCSTAAGPAFEGAELTSGMSGMAGAIDKVYLTGDTIEYTVIGGVNPQGICGSGIIDLISVLLIIGAIDETGRFEENILLKYNVLGNYNGHSACKLANEIYITQEDIRKIQLAKSAISSGILTLASRIDTTVEKLYVAGGFGSFLDLDSAINIGLIPAQFRDKTEIIGNAALDGASRILCNEKEKYNISNITQNVKAIDLSQSKTFMQYYIENMLFG
ncbi:MAG: ASKHA domain-containing protein, partial [Oscillospiraceae bacterium]